jgi:hypothetical protein
VQPTVSHWQVAGLNTSPVVEPHVVECSQPNGAHPVGCGAWVQVPTDDPSEDYGRLARICLSGEQWLIEGSPLYEVLGIIDQTQKRLREGNLSEVC